jgi:dTDP-4-dehydrorhamnose reductase
VKLLLLGPEGQVGWELQRSLAALGQVIAADRQRPTAGAGDLEKSESLRATIRRLHPDVIVNAAAHTAVDAAEKEPDRARQINALAPGVLAEEAVNTGALLVHYSTDYVFDGSGSQPWREQDITGPLSVYGQTKLEGEELIRSSGCRHLIFRTCWVYASRGRNFLRTMLRLAAERDSLAVVSDQVGAPTGAELIADVTAHAIRSASTSPGISGIWHLAASGYTSWHGYASHAIATARDLGFPVRVPADAIRPCATTEFPTPARRPFNSRLSTTKLCETFGLQMPDWREGVDRAIRELGTK